MPPDDSTGRGPIPLGPVGGYLIENLKDLRNRRRMTYKDLAGHLKELGRPIPTLGLSRIERGERRVDADDLVALALALGVNPSALLLPRATAPDELVDLATDYQARARDAWNWADGNQPMPAAGEEWSRPTRIPDMERVQLIADFIRHARPEWSAVPDWPALLQRAGGDPVITEDLATHPIPAEEGVKRPIATAIVTSDRGVLVGRRNDGTPPWTFIAGEVEPGESPADAAGREVKEEAGGLRVQVGDVIGERVHPQTHRRMIYLAAAPTHGTEIHVGDEEELAEVRWVSLAEAGERLPGMFGPVREHLARELGEGE